ncbi:MAG: metallophosphoesterase family protein [Chloroflexia bacterium]
MDRSGVRFAVINDLHLGHLPLPTDFVMPEEARGLLDRAVAALNSGHDLDYVLLNGDLIDNGTPAEMDDVITLMNRLREPWYATPGNHDIALPPDSALLNRRRFYERLAEKVPRAAEAYAGAAERGSWTCSVRPGVRLVGLDSNIEGDWGGRLDDGQLAWLDGILAAAVEPLVILAIHHPMHAVFGSWTEPVPVGQDWRKFFCSNGAEIEAVLDRYPNVELVLTAHDHMSRVDWRSGRLHIASPALGSYPLAYLTVEVEPEGEGWAVRWETQTAAADPELRERARRRLADSGLSRAYDPGDPRRMEALAEGRPQDQRGSSTLPDGPFDRG